MLFPDAERGAAGTGPPSPDGALTPSVPHETRPATIEEATLLRGALQCSLSPETFLTWFSRSRLIAHEGEAAVLAVPNTFARDWIERYYSDVLRSCAVSVLGPGRTVVVRAAPEALVGDAPADNGVGTAPAVGATPPNGGAGHATGHQGAGEHRATGPQGYEAAGTGPAPGGGGTPGAGGWNHGAAPQGGHAPAAGHGHGFPPAGGGSHGAPAPPPIGGAAPNGATPSMYGGPSPVQQPTPSQPAGAYAPGVAPKHRHLHDGSDLVLNPKCTFDSFVVGPCNRFGHAAALGASEQPGKSYNPLFLHGRVGVGKTHLLQAFCHAILDSHPESRILYLSCETFVNHFIDALENGNTQEFREKYRNIDVLVVDDVQVLANKEKTQEEFFHTFNTLYNAGKQIVLSSDSPPKDIPTLQDRLVSRFKWGMVTELEAPCLETRMAIVKRKAKDKGAVIPDEVVEFIAENIEENVREIEGAVTRLIGYTSLSRAPLTLEVARETLAGLIEVRRGAPTIDNIVGLVTEHFQVKLAELQSKKRTKAIAFPRQVAMYLARKLTRHSLEEIGGFFGGRDHTTVMYAVDRITKQQTEDTDLARLIQSFIEQLAGKK